MIFHSPKGKHRARPLRIGIWRARPVFIWQVEFTPTCRYSLIGADQLDTNKLIGVGFLPGHHVDSARFGWRYSPERGMVELLAYCYVRRRRVIEPIGFVEIGQPYRLQLNVTLRAYVFDVYGEREGMPIGACSISHHHRKKLQYRLGTYFGGNQPAPHDIKIKIENK
jgi:hypothetical protein